MFACIGESSFPSVSLSSPFSGRSNSSTTVCKSDLSSDIRFATGSSSSAWHITSLTPLAQLLRYSCNSSRSDRHFSACFFKPSFSVKNLFTMMKRSPVCCLCSFLLSSLSVLFSFSIFCTICCTRIVNSSLFLRSFSTFRSSASFSVVSFRIQASSSLE